jgi:nitroreductase/NAD-dependent dihydropyrimidine dehydrogenase PreA subunit
MGFNVNHDTCQKCQLCIEVCPCNIIEYDKNNLVNFIAERESICLHCGQCMAVCTTKSIEVEGLSYEQDFVNLPKSDVDYKSYMDFISTRRSVRNFKSKAVEDEKIEQILDSISFAPHGASPEKINITVVKNRSVIESALPHMEHFLDNIVKWVDNPIASYMIKRKKGEETFNTVKNHLYPLVKAGNYNSQLGDRITRNAPLLIIFHADKGAEEHTNNSLIYATYAMFAAQALGLGTTMIGIVPAAINKVKEVREIFHIPEENEAVISLIAGYPKYKYQRAIKRSRHKIEYI